MPGILGMRLGLGGAAAISWSGSAWDAISLAHPTSSGNTNTVTATFAGAARTLTASDAGNGIDHTLSYSLNGAAFTPYSSGFSISSGDTLRWLVSGAATDFVYTVVITDSATSATTGSISISKTGSP